jgi:hypothetical protein
MRRTSAGAATPRSPFQFSGEYNYEFDPDALMPAPSVSGPPTLPAAVDNYIDARMDMERRMSASGPRRLPQAQTFGTSQRRASLSYR